MKMSGNERISRSFALEQTYVHEVYEKYYDNPRNKPWPKVQEFLEKIEPGALVCDVGCGNGKYLKVNMSIYNLGAEKSFRLSNLARQNENEVIRLDNLAMPFKDNCFDSVLSLSVIHHFATTDRRVSALREMTRVLRVGGRMIITVWAMEQEHRKFESQDVLVPWKRPRPIRTCELSESQSENDDIIRTQDIFSNLHHQETADQNKSFRFRDTFRKKSRTAQQQQQQQQQQRNNKYIIPMDPSSYRKTSSGSSTLSSPSETCYGFVRRALQKIAGGGRRVVANSWFLDNWIACMHKQQPLHKRYDSDGCEYCECSGSDNPEDQPIELLRIDDEEPKQISRRLTCPVSQMSADIDAFKSKSMNNIRTLPKTNTYKTTISSTNKVQLIVNQNKENLEISSSISSVRNTQLKKPKLVKQKKSLCDDFEEDEVEALDQPTDMKNLVRTMPDFKLSRYDSRGAILKQRSLNEDILSTDRLREKERLKQNIQKQTSLNEELIFKRTPTFESLRESFFAVTSSKGFQLFKNGLTNRIKNSTTMEKVATTSLKNGFVKIFQTWKGTELLKSPTSTKDNEFFKGVQNSVPSESNEKDGERRHSKEDGSDSSKDSSLQSDTSVDSEDSFASVIFVPKSDPMSPIGGAVNNLSAGPASPLCRASCQSAPQSPRIKQSSCPTSPRIKQIPNGMHPLTKQLSSPKPSTDFLPVLNTLFPFTDAKMRDNSRLSVAPQMHQIVPLQPTRKDLAQKYSVQPIPQFKKTTRNTPNFRESLDAPNELVNAESSKIIKQINTVISAVSPPENNKNAEVSRTEKLIKIREILAQKPGFGTKSKSHCPIVKKISDPDKKDQSLVKPIPKLLKFEIFNPIEDDDSDNSCVSSPDSTGSINSVKSVEKFKYPIDDNDAVNINKGKSLNLLETGAENVTMNNSQETVEKVINTRTKQLPNVDVFSILQRRFSSDTEPLIEENDEYCGEESRRSSNTWNEECHKHLTAFADQLSEKLMKELDEYQLTMENIDDPYIHRLSEELHDLSILSEEIKKQNEYLTKFAQKPNKTIISRKCVKCKKLPECGCTLPLPLRTHQLLNRTNNCDKRVVNEKNVRLPCVNNINNNSSVNNSVVFTNTNNNNRLNNESGVNVHKFDENLSRNLSDTHHGDQFDGELNEVITMKNSIVAKGSSSDSFDSSEKGSSSNSLLSSGATSINFAGQSVASSVTDLTERDSRDCCSNDEGSTASLVSIESKGRNLDRLTPRQLKRRDQSGLSDISADSWPTDEIGGEITFHRYYHVFRQGELEKLIEKYVDDLHVVSSTYEHASWCIIAEKVQIWTI